MLMRVRHGCLLVLDVQQHLIPVMSDPRRVIRNCGLLLRIARRLKVPSVVGELRSRGHDPVVADLLPLMPTGGTVARSAFSCADDAETLRRLAATGRRQIVVAGIEAHIAILESALALAALGYQVFVAMDACAARRAEDERLAEARLRQAGVVIVGLEMVLHEWLRGADAEAFRELSQLLR